MPQLAARACSAGPQYHPVMGALAPVPRICGREAEIQVLGEALDRVAAGGPAIVLVEGEAGIGKTRLLAQVVQDAAGRDMQVASVCTSHAGRCKPISGTCSPSSTSPPAPSSPPRRSGTEETTRGERLGLIIRPPADKQRWIVFFYGIGGPVRRWLGSAGYGLVCVEYAGFGVSSGSPSEYGCYRSADAAIKYLQRHASIHLDKVTLIGWSFGSAVAIDLACRRDIRAQVLLSPMTSLLACAIDLARFGKTSFAIGPFDALSKARSVDCPTLIISGSEDALTRPWMADELTKAMGGHARLVSLPGVGHNDMLRSGESLWNVVKDFLNSTE